jgi:hypothetical protein
MNIDLARRVFGDRTPVSEREGILAVVSRIDPGRGHRECGSQNGGA